MTYCRNLLVDLGRVSTLSIRVFARCHFQETHAKGVDIDLFAVSLFFVHFRSHEFRGTNDRVFFAHLHLGRTHIANLDFAVSPVNKDIVALYIAVDDWRIVAVQIDQPFQNLPRPTLHDFRVGQAQFPNVLS